LKHVEKVALFKSFGLFFGTLQLLVSAVLWLLYWQEVDVLRHQTMLEMRTYNYTLQGEHFAIDFVPTNSTYETYTFYEENEELFALFPITQTPATLLRLSLPPQAWRAKKEALLWEFVPPYAFGTLVTLLLALFFAHYTLKPLRNALSLQENFIRDVIHDLNTPITSLLLNTQMLAYAPTPTRLARTVLSAQIIQSLYENLSFYQEERPLTLVDVDLNKLLSARIDYFKSLYGHLTFELQGTSDTPLKTDTTLFLRIIDNLLSNACKYNRPNGSVTLRLEPCKLTVADTGVGIKNVRKVFRRYYKEHERGLGIGLDIVARAIRRLHYTIDVDSSAQGTQFHLTFC